MNKLMKVKVLKPRWRVIYTQIELASAHRHKRNTMHENGLLKKHHHYDSETSVTSL